MRNFAPSGSQVKSRELYSLRYQPVAATRHLCICFQNIAMDWKSDPLDRARGPSRKATPQKSRREFVFGGAFRYRYKRELH